IQNLNHCSNCRSKRIARQLGSQTHICCYPAILSTPASCPWTCMEEGSVDREQRAGARWRTVFLIAYCAFVVFCLTNDDYLLLIFGVLNVPLVVFLLVRRFM